MPKTSPRRLNELYLLMDAQEVKPRAERLPDEQLHRIEKHLRDGNSGVTELECRELIAEIKRVRRWTRF